MNFKLLRYVVTIAELRSFSGAAKRLYLSQPSLSQSIIALEKELGTPLFDRGTAPLSLTYAGEVFVDSARQILQIESETVKRIEDIAENRGGRLAVGISPFRNPTIFSLMFPLFSRIYPEVKIALTEAPSDQLCELALAGDIDLVFITGDIPPGLAGTKILTDRILLAVSSENPLCGHYSFEEGPPKANLDHFREVPFILLPPNATLRKFSNRIFTQHLFEPKIAMETLSLELAVKLTSQSHMATMVFESSIRCEGGQSPSLRGFVFESADQKVPVSICYRKNLYLTRVMMTFIHLCEQAAAEAGGGQG